MVVIRILDHVLHASSYDDGQAIYALIAQHIVAGEPVCVSFEGIHTVPSAFINSAFVRLLEVATISQVRKYLRVKDSTRFINDLIKKRFEFAEIAKNKI
ncbi:STAS-like domain-containing protein [Delftia tsuruhatensis]|uniref:STAS-like domain-containing protein n=1 Tax=Delftia tsuruhatensis TaxID=180282 RepID=UPI0028B03A9C|nr:DUF4325 domain-containing protein [Delftia tsuruhatensis]